MSWRLLHRPQREEAILEAQVMRPSPLCSHHRKPVLSLGGSVGPQGGFKVVSGWGGELINPSTAYIPPLWMELGSILTWGSGRETWGRRRRGGACRKAEEGRAVGSGGGRETAQLEVGLRRESSRAGLPGPDPPPGHPGGPPRVLPSQSAGLLSLPLSYLCTRPSVSMSVYILGLSLFLGLYLGFGLHCCLSVPTIVSTCVDLCLTLPLPWLGAQ